jgi:hypothetical protein
MTDRLTQTEASMTRMPFIAAIRLSAAVSAIAAAVLAAPAPAGAQAGYNGTWSVLIVTDSGPCDRAYRYPLRLNNGEVSYAGQADFNVSGRVRNDGSVNVTVTRREQRASGTGRLRGGSGSGTWRGTDVSGTCTGTWTAEKRG